MITRAFGGTGLTVSILGLGAGALGDAALPEADAGRLLHTALECGITLIDTAPSYGLSEERIGRHLAGRRGEFVLSTKGGYGVPGVPDWTPAAIRGGIEAALGRLRTDHLDIFHLHSCPLDVLCREDLLAELSLALRRGQILVAAYSGENEALAWAVDSRRFGAVQASVNPFDQRALQGVLPRAAAAGLGVIGKRPLGNTPWRFPERPAGHYAETYWERMQAMGLGYSPAEWPERALRFGAFSPGVTSIIAGSRDPGHLRDNVRLVERGPLPENEAGRIRAAFQEHDRGFYGQV